jgi:hypothetical protein
MVKLPLKLATIFAIIAFISLAGATVSAKNNLTSLACGCSYATKLDVSLPLSHPKNRCADNNTTRDISWFTWLSGKTKSNQFHYLDLLELLSRHTESKYSKHS